MFATDQAPALNRTAYVPPTIHAFVGTSIISVVKLITLRDMRRSLLHASERKQLNQRGWGLLRRRRPRIPKPRLCQRQKFRREGTVHEAR